MFDPTNQRPATAVQVDYLSSLVKRLHEEADWSQLETSMASTAINELNRVRKAASLKFVPMEGMDTTRYA